ncbi:MAG: 4Fe-4S dicluster domain-containing protein [Gammaproteobacteria bacterium]|nr:4Fe-4S dicluster domain-containing protein [Gammaproteobacteria bacterium]MBU1645673.1 4Fe-4S dicluster domain-containing protein [Gammaproteobacteria bacterium]MBU1970778.1 4Fe-4S dicluster domain-containing protein [Gammaproteobacteria bacterium]
MSAPARVPQSGRLLLSGNEAVARAVWESGCKVAAAYPGTPSTEILEALSIYPDIYAEWAVNEKVSMEVALGASMMGARAFCAMKHVGLNVAADPLMTLTLTGVVGGMVIAVADDVGMASSQNEQDSRFYARFAHLPVFEPADSQEAYDMVHAAYALSEKHQVPVILRLTARICHVKSVARVGERVAHEPAGFVKNAERWVMVPAHAKRRIPMMFERDAVLREESERSPLNVLEPGSDRRVGFVTSGPAYMHVREAFPDAPVLKLGMSHPLPLDKVKALAGMADTLVVVEEVEPIVENELRTAGFKVHGKDILPKIGELAPEVLTPAIDRLLNNEPPPPAVPAPAVFPRPPTLCASCPHMGIYYTLSQLKNIIVAGDIGCYTLGAGHPWNALDTTICMGAAVTVAHGMDKGRGEVDKNKKILAVMGDSTFMHMGMQGLLDATYNNSNITFLLLDNGTVGMTGGQNTPANGRDIRGNPAPRIDFRKLVEALGVKPERVREVDPYEMPNLFKVIREETKIEEVSVIIAYRPCVLIDEFKAMRAYYVDEDKCTGCSNCLDVGCPAIHVTRREMAVKPSGREVELTFVNIDPIACTGCGMCVKPCAPDAILQPDAPRIVAKLTPI